MRKEDKTELTKERIMQAAMEEFGLRGYAAASINNICETGIAKGLIYHNFKNKDELYISCVKRSFLSLLTYLKEQNVEFGMQDYMHARLLFFGQNPLETRLFFEAIIQPPAHLMSEIKELKREFDLYNQEMYQNLFTHITLRTGVTKEGVLEYFAMMQDMFNGYFSSQVYRDIPILDLVDKHEELLSRLLEYMLFGVAERGNELLQK